MHQTALIQLDLMENTRSSHFLPRTAHAEDSPGKQEKTSESGTQQLTAQTAAEPEPPFSSSQRLPVTHSPWDDFLCQVSV